MACGAFTLALLAPSLSAAQFDEPGKPIDGKVEPRVVVSHFFVPADKGGSAEMQTVIGNSQAYTIKAGDTFLEISRKFDVGYNELVAAHPELDPWVPQPGVSIVIPTEWVLPKGPYKGLVLNIPEMRFYYYVPSPRRGAESSTVITYPVGLGRRDWQTPQGSFRIRGKTRNPTWVIPESIREERYRETGATDTAIRGGDPQNPLGHYRIELTLPSYAIHGTNKNWGIGMQVSHGCVRMFPEDIKAFFPLVAVGGGGRFTYEPVKVGVQGGRVIVEVHEDIYGVSPWPWMQAQERISEMGLTRYVDSELLEAAVEAQSGVPTDVSYVDWPVEKLDETITPEDFDDKGNLIRQQADGEHPAVPATTDAG